MASLEDSAYSVLTTYESDEDEDDDDESPFDKLPDYHQKIEQIE